MFLYSFLGQSSLHSKRKPKQNKTKKKIYRFEEVWKMSFSLKLTKLRATLDFPGCKLPYWMGNKFRGGFGNVLQKAICNNLRPVCAECPNTDECLYYVLYERGKQKRGQSQPVRPINFIPPFFGRSYSGKGLLTLHINIFGNYIRYLPHIVYGLRYLGKNGLNKDSMYIVDNITDFFTKEVIYDGDTVDIQAVKTIDLSKISGKTQGDIISIKYQTPIELEKTPLHLNYLIHMVRRRLIFYVNEYGSGEVPDYECDDIIVWSEWKKHKLKHRSKRSGMREFYAFTGKADYKIDNCDSNAIKLLNIGSLIGAGSKSSYGMGFFEID